MCRWLMYKGEKTLMANLLVAPENSLIHQSIDSHEGVVNVNGDGFGIGWYSKFSDEPGMYKDPFPAWNNKNLVSIASHIASGNFFAHVRASTGTPSTTTNCHPFRYKNHLFMHNGSIGKFPEIRRDLESLIDSEYYQHRYGCTDSEALFLLALTNGLVHDVKTAINKTVEQIFEIQQKHGFEKDIKASMAYTDGKTSFAIKKSTHEHQPSLYYANCEELLDSIGEDIKKDKYTDTSIYHNSFIILSEPLLKSDAYKRIPNNCMIKICDKDFIIEKM